MRSLMKLLSIALTTLSLGGCDALYNHVHDPGMNIPKSEIIKSLRCEIVTFFESNYQRSVEHANLTSQDELELANRYFGFFDLDRWQYAALQVDLKDILSSTAMSGFDWKYPTRRPNSQNSKSWHVGPQITLSGTYDSTQLFAIPQYASLGPSSLVKDETEKLYAAPNSTLLDNNQYFCYKLITPIEYSREKRLADLQSFVSGSLPDFENFKRVRVDGERTLALWLQQEAQKMSEIQRSAIANGENLIPAQFIYSFAIEIKASIDLRYTLIANARNPFMPDISGGVDNTGTFTLYMNGSKSKAASAAKAGQAAILPIQRRLVPQTAGVVSEVN